jgi:glycosyltransferase involved in cell wall biosynthesis
MKNILISGPLLSNTGYGVHSRQIFEYAFSNKSANDKVFCNVTNWGNSAWHLSDDTTSGQFKKILSCHIPESQMYDIEYDECYSIDYPKDWLTLGKTNIGVTAGVETDLVPKGWINCVNKMSKVIVPSEFTKNAFIKTSELNKIKLLKEIYVIPEYFYESLTDKNLDSFTGYLSGINTEQNLLLIGQITSLDSKCDRKNIINAIESTARILSNIENSGLILKLNAGNNSQLDFIRTKELIKPIIDNLKNELKEKSPKIYLLHGNLSEIELKELYTTKASALLCLSKGEGFGLTLLEAAACGCPIIATNYSAYTEFLGDKFSKVEYELDVIPDSKVNNIFIKQARWANYLNKSLHKTIVNFFNKKSDYINIAKELQDFIIVNYNKQVILDKYKECLK